MADIFRAKGGENRAFLGNFTLFLKSSSIQDKLRLNSSDDQVQSRFNSSSVSAGGLQ
jgi:hypothetical protein